MPTVTIAGGSHHVVISDKPCKLTKIEVVKAGVSRAISGVQFIDETEVGRADLPHSKHGTFGHDGHEGAFLYRLPPESVEGDVQEVNKSAKCGLVCQQIDGGPELLVTFE